VDLDLFKAVLSIAVIDLVLSGDNAVVIGMAASRLNGAARRRAILLGAGGAVVLRVLFTALVALLLGVPLLQLVGGVLLLWIAVKLVRPASTGHGEGVTPAASSWEAVRTIVLADLVMSLDNILAVGGSAHGDLRLLLFGLALSIPLITVGSGLVARALDRWAWLTAVGAAVLAWTAGEMLLEDPFVHARLDGLGWLEWVVPIVLAVGVLGLGMLLRRRTMRGGSADQTTSE
jgi:YjbE family integral membrane protein